MIDKCEACLKTTEVDRAHIRTRGSGAGWSDDEWMYLCRPCHVEQGQIGWAKMIAKHSHLIRVLKERNWHLTKEFGVYKLRRI
jgi:hypothetical protein